MPCGSRQPYSTASYSRAVASSDDNQAGGFGHRIGIGPRSSILGIQALGRAWTYGSSIPRMVPDSRYLLTRRPLALSASSRFTRVNVPISSETTTIAFGWRSSHSENSAIVLAILTHSARDPGRAVLPRPGRYRSHRSGTNTSLAAGQSAYWCWGRSQSRPARCCSP